MEQRNAALESAIVRYQEAVRALDVADVAFKAASESHLAVAPSARAWAAKMAALGELTQRCTQRNVAARELLALVEAGAR